MKLYAVCVYLFLYIPIGVIALFSFNAGRHASQLQAKPTTAIPQIMMISSPCMHAR